MRYSKQKKIIRTMWPCFNIDSKVEYSQKKSYILYLVEWVWRIVSYLNWTYSLLGLSMNTIGKIEISTQGKTRPLLLLHDDVHPHLTEAFKTFVEKLNSEVCNPHNYYLSFLLLTFIFITFFLITWIVQPCRLPSTAV